MKEYEVKPLIGMVGLFSIAFFVYVISNPVSAGLKFLGAISMVVFLFSTTILFGYGIDRRYTVLYTLVVLLAILKPLWVGIPVIILILLYVVTMLFKHMMEG